MAKFLFQKVSITYASKTFCVFFMLQLSIIMGHLQAQDPHFSQFYSNPLYLNPALAGMSTCSRVHVNYRNQWPSIGNLFGDVFTTYSASYDRYIADINSGVGIICTYDNEGNRIFNTLNSGLIYSYTIPVGRKLTVSAALQAGAYWRYFDGHATRYADQFDETNLQWSDNTSASPHDAQNRIKPDFAFGTVAFWGTNYAGFAVHHLVPFEEGLAGNFKLSRKYTVHGGKKIFIGNKRQRKTNTGSYISPNVLYLRQGTNQQMNFGFYMGESPLNIGIWYRQNFVNSDAFIILAGLDKEKWTFGYSYDISVSKLASFSGGAHEISLSFRFKCDQQKKKYKVREINCPKF